MRIGQKSRRACGPVIHAAPSPSLRFCWPRRASRVRLSLCRNHPHQLGPCWRLTDALLFRFTWLRRVSDNHARRRRAGGVHALVQRQGPHRLEGDRQDGRLGGRERRDLRLGAAAAAGCSPTRSTATSSCAWNTSCPRWATAASPCARRPRAIPPTSAWRSSSSTMSTGRACKPGSTPAPSTTSCPPRPSRTRRSATGTRCASSPRAGRSRSRTTARCSWMPISTITSRSTARSTPASLREKGHLGFQSYNFRVEFRNIYLKELK